MSNAAESLSAALAKTRLPLAGPEDALAQVALEDAVQNHLPVLIADFHRLRDAAADLVRFTYDAADNAYLPVPADLLRAANKVLEQYDPAWKDEVFKRSMKYHNMKAPRRPAPRRRK